MGLYGCLQYKTAGVQTTPSALGVTVNKKERSQVIFSLFGVNALVL